MHMGKFSTFERSQETLMAVALAVHQLGLLDVPLKSSLKCVYRCCEVVGDPNVATALLRFRHYIDKSFNL